MKKSLVPTKSLKSVCKGPIIRSRDLFDASGKFPVYKLGNGKIVLDCSGYEIDITGCTTFSQVISRVFSCGKDKGVQYGILKMGGTLEDVHSYIKNKK